jgi:hypothetical protein
MAIDRAAKTWARIADVTNTAIELVHHTRKMSSSSAGEPSADDARGASAMVNAARSVRVLSRMSKDDGHKAGIENPRMYFSIDPVKQNLSPPAEERTWRQLVSVGLGNGTDERPEDLVGVVASWNWPDTFADIVPGDLERVQAVIANGEWKENVQASNWAGKAIADVLGLDVSDPQAKARIKAMLRSWIRSGAFVVIQKRDKGRRQCPFVEVGTRADA